MCGIAGKIDFDGAADAALLDRMCGAIQHRGPDSRGTYVEGGAALGAQRLAIVDVAGGDQPLFNEDRTVVVVANGEIYNHAELRAELERRGHRFRSHVDTEVIAHLYEECGDALVERLRGMFAFAVWDVERRRLLCGRDRVGKKPLYWARRGSTFWFASEVRALLEDPELGREVDPAAIRAYLALQYVPQPLSAFKAIRKLAPAATLDVTRDRERERSYWSLDYTRKAAGSETELAERVWDKLREATRIRLMSEVPLGAFLSGGIDSSAVVAAMAEHSSEPIKTFSIGFADDDYDELAFARIVAERFGTDHHEFVVEPDAVAVLPRLVRHYGEPFADSSAIPTFYVAELTSRHVTVALNGDGGDESFAGYPRYAINARVSRYALAMPAAFRNAAILLANAVGDGPHRRALRSRLSRGMRVAAATPAERYARWMAVLGDDEFDRLLTPEFAARSAGECDDLLVRTWDEIGLDDVVDSMMGVDVRTYLPGDLLTKVDIATMAHSLEGRSPFLDHELMELAASLPSDLKLHNGTTKHILKTALEGVLPGELLHRRKMGFSVPLARWLREALRDLPADVLLDPRSLERGYFQRSEIERMIREHHDGAVDHAPRLWTLLQLELWHREVVEAPPAIAQAA